MTPISKRQRARLNIYKKQKKIKHLYIYRKSETLCKKHDNLRYIIIHKKPYNLRYVNVNENFEIGIYIFTKIKTLYVT